VGEIDTTRPNAARMYDYYLGGSASFPADREAAEAGLAVLPHAREYALANRAFLGRVVGYLARLGVDQFLDLGSGIPTMGNVHHIVRRHNPRGRVAYVDHEPVAVAHARYLLADDDRVSIDQADIREPEQVLRAPGVRRLVDFRRPLAVLAVAILPFVVDDDEAARLLRAYRGVCAPHSFLALSHISPLAATPQEVTAAEQVMARTPTPVRWRSRDQIAALLTGYTMLPPGLVPTPQWKPTQPPNDAGTRHSNAYAALAIHT
jgi:hypothetical protein